VTDELVVVSAGGNARTIAYDKLTGEVRWRSGTGKAGYAAIQLMQLKEEMAVLSFHGTGFAGMALKDGRQLWDTEWITDYDVNATTPVYKGDLVFMTSGYGTGCQLLKVSASGSEIVWKNKAIASHHSDPFIINGFIYGYSGLSAQNRGYFKCLDLKTGEEKWSSREMGWGTALYIEGHLLCMDIKGNLFLMKPDPQKLVMVTQWPKSLGKIRGAAWTIPVVANGKLFLRFKQKLICYRFVDS
jgi:outer membrane protein assembly factor BamB